MGLTFMVLISMLTKKTNCVIKLFIFDIFVFIMVFITGVCFLPNFFSGTPGIYDSYSQLC